MNTEVQKKIIDKNVAIVNKVKNGFINTYCDSIKNQVINNISVCDKFDDEEIIDVKELHNVEKVLL